MTQALQERQASNDSCCGTPAGRRPSALPATRGSRIRFGPGERMLQSAIAGMTWRPILRHQGRLPQRAQTRCQTRTAAPPRTVCRDPRMPRCPRHRRRAGPAEERRVAVARLDPADARHPGPHQDRTAAPEGRAARLDHQHKTGTGQELGALQTGYNDVGVITGPDGRSYAVAVMIRRTSAPLDARIAIFQKVARTLAQWHAKSGPAQQASAATAKQG